MRVESVGQKGSLVSVVVPTYQQVEFIGPCLDGILMQRTDFPVEVLVGEDGSSDGTREICQRYAEEYTGRIKLFLRDRKLKPQAEPPGRSNLIGLMNDAQGSLIAR